MARTQVAILYSVAQRLRRALIIPDDDSQLDAIVARPGEKLIRQSLIDYAARGPDAAVLDDAGGPPRSDRCAVVGNGNVVARHIKADPAIDTLPGATLVASDISIEGDSYIPGQGQFRRRYVIADAAGNVTRVVTANPATPPGPDVAGGQVLGGSNLNPGDRIPNPGPHS